MSDLFFLFSDSIGETNHRRIPFQKTQYKMHESRYQFMHDAQIGKLLQQIDEKDQP